MKHTHWFAFTCNGRSRFHYHAFNRGFVSLVVFFFLFQGKAQLSPEQERLIDSLKKVVNTAPHDTVIIKAWKAWDDIIYVSDPELDLELNEKMAARASRKRKTKLHKKEKIFYLQTRAFALNNIGTFYYQHADYAKAFENYFASLKIAEELKDTSRVALTLGNIANVYFSQENYNKSLEYNLKSLAIKKQIGHKNGIAVTLSNIASVYSAKNDHTKALESYFEALQMAEELKYEQLQANNLLNIGLVYFRLKKHTESEEYFFKALKMYEQIGDKNGIAVTLGHMGSLFINMGKFAEAEKYLLRASGLSESVGARSFHRDHHFNLSRLYDTTGRPGPALFHYKKFISVRDSIASEENLKNQTRIEMNYEFEKKQAEQQARQDKKDAVAAADALRQRIILFAVAGVGLLVLGFAVFIARNLRLTRKQKVIIEEQKTMVEQKHKEITDSINYAERIQRSFLATKEMLDNNLADYFVLFKPKEIVSGDFYWAAKFADGRFLLTCADSTGHGVPGAIMSVLNISSLEKAIEKETEPAAILNQTRKLIIDRLKKDGSAEGGKDGMDCSIARFDFRQMKLDFALANNPLWIIRDGHLLEHTPDKMPVGRHQKENIPFLQHTIELKINDLVVLLTDGYADQFGGPKGKKFKYAVLQQLLVANAKLPTQALHQKLQTSFDQWKGDLEQVDDVTIIGVRIR